MSDAAMFAAMGHGGDPRFEDLYREWYLPIVSICRKRLGSTGDPEAVAQEAFVRAWRSWNRYSPDRPFGPWVSTIARRLCTNETIAHRRRERRSTDARVGLADTPDDPSELQRVIESTSVEQALDRLPARQRRLLVLRVVDDWSYDEIARLEGMTTEAVRSGLKRARAGFRLFYRGSYGVLPEVVAAMRRLAAQLPFRSREHQVGLLFGRAGGLEVACVVVASLLFAGGGGDPRAPLAQGPTTARAPRPDTGVTGREVTAADSVTSVGTDSRRSGATTLVEPAPSSDDDAVDAVDVHYHRFTVSPSYEDDHTVFLTAEEPDCRSSSCAVLFKSTDGGATWARLPAAGRSSGPILLPPSYPRDSRIFSLSRLGAGVLSVSEDAGTTFRVLAPSSGSGAMSPLFSTDDPRIFFGSGMVGSPVPTAYNDHEASIEPLLLPLPSNVAPVSFAFAPTYATERRLLASAVWTQTKLHAEFEHAFTPGVFAGIYSCTPEACEPAFEMRYGTSAIDIVWNEARPDAVVAWTPHTVHRSADGGRSFEEVEGLPPGLLRTIEAGADGRMFAVVVGEGGDLLYVSYDGGASWTPVGGETTGLVGDLVVLPDGALLAARDVNGGRRVGCSFDGGRTWMTGCQRGASVTSSNRS